MIFFSYLVRYCSGTDFDKAPIDAIMVKKQIRNFKIEFFHHRDESMFVLNISRRMLEVTVVCIVSQSFETNLKFSKFPMPCSFDFIIQIRKTKFFPFRYSLICDNKRNGRIIRWTIHTIWILRMIDG